MMFKKNVEIQTRTHACSNRVCRHQSTGYKNFQAETGAQICQFRNLRLRGLSKRKPRQGFTSHTLHPLAPPNQDRLWHRIVDTMATASSMLRPVIGGAAVPLSRASVGLMRLRPSSSVPRKKTRI